MGDCKYCNGNRYIVYYGNVGVCADCSDDLLLSNIFEMQTTELQKLKEENKLLRECVEFIITESSNYDISNLNLIQLYVCKARQTLAKIKGDE